jgi:BirA family biotin operon repressor/biotin-[acetyl-CoA-carboxylase] ligase
MEQKAATLSQGDFERIRAETFVREIEWREELGSTNDLALELAARPEVRTPVLVGAALQTAGRGRGANRWWSSAGALTFSLLLETAAPTAPSERLARVSLTAALAVCEALQAMLPGADVGLKWPNDVRLNHRKVAGVLVETPPRRPVRVVVGVGINVNNSLASAPLELQRSATSLLDEAGRPFEPSRVLLRVLKRLSALIAAPAACQPPLADRWRTFCVLRDRLVHVAAGSRTVAGVCQGIDEHGALVLRTPRGQDRLFTGVVSEVE